MITAHLPAGYLLGRGVNRPGRFVLPAALVGSIFPDFDLAYFVLIDNWSVHHHRYWVHVPFFWMILSAVILPLVWRTAARLPALAFLASVFLHLILDTVVGDIMWGAPFSARLVSFFDVPPSHDFWLWSFLLHWSFALEAAIWVAAVTLWINRPRRQAA